MFFPDALMECGQEKRIRAQDVEKKPGDRRSRCCGLELLGSIQTVSVLQAAKNSYSRSCAAVKAEHQTTIKNKLKHTKKIEI